MTKFRIALLILCCLYRQQLYGQKYIEYIKQNSSEIEINFDTENFDDLSYLKQKIGNASVVMLGEATHGDGTTLQTKARIIKFLHEQMDFNILALESSSYNADRAWDAAHWEKDPINCIQNSSLV